MPNPFSQGKGTVCHGSYVQNFSDLCGDGEPQVTLQIGMVASDGFVIVGDMWKHVPSSKRQTQWLSLPMTADDRLTLIRVKIERAYKHLDELEAEVVSLGEATFKLISLDHKPETGKPFL